MLLLHHPRARVGGLWEASHRAHHCYRAASAERGSGSVILWVGGGVGLTPVLSMLKDIYLPYKNGKIPPHCMRRVVTYWQMPNTKAGVKRLPTTERQDQPS